MATPKEVINQFIDEVMNKQNVDLIDEILPRTLSGTCLSQDRVPVARDCARR